MAHRLNLKMVICALGGAMLMLCSACKHETVYPTHPQPNWQVVSDVDMRYSMTIVGALPEHLIADADTADLIAAFVVAKTQQGAPADCPGAQASSPAISGQCPGVQASSPAISGQCPGAQASSPAYKTKSEDSNRSDTLCCGLTRLMAIPQNSSSLSGEGDGGETGTASLLRAFLYITLPTGVTDDCRIILRYYATRTQYLYQSDVSISFQSDAIIGNITDPYEIPFENPL